MNETAKPTPPARHSEKLFRRFESAIYTVVTQFPNVLTISTLSPNAYACGFRNAMKSLHDFQWETVVPHNRFLELYDAKEIVTRELPGKVVIGSRQTTKFYNASKQQGEMSGLIIKPDAEGEKAVVNYKDNAAWAVCDLASRRLLVQPIILRGLPVETATELSQSFDVLLEPIAGNEGDWLLT